MVSGEPQSRPPLFIDFMAILQYSHAVPTFVACWPGLSIWDQQNQQNKGMGVPTKAGRYLSL